MRRDDNSPDMYGYQLQNEVILLTIWSDYWIMDYLVPSHTGLLANENWLTV